jgi:Na+/melibiose symporter-like transporter
MDSADLAGWAILIVIILGPFLFAFVTAYFAGWKNRSRVGWGIAGFFLGAIALIILAFCDFLCPKCNQKLSNEDRKNHTCSNCAKLEADIIKPNVIPFNEFLEQLNNNKENLQ